MKAFRVAALLFVFGVAASFAVETNTLPTTITVDGITYSNVTWRTVTPATVSIFHQTGVASIPLEKLPPELQKRFGYDTQKAAEYRAAERSTETARQEALQRWLASEEAGRQREAKEDAAKRAAEDAKKEVSQDSAKSLGPVVKLEFWRAFNIKGLPDGMYSANISDADADQVTLVTFPEDGLAYIKQASINPGIRYTVYGQSYMAQLQNVYGTQSTEKAYWLVGMTAKMPMGGPVSYSW